MMKERKAVGEHLLADLFGVAPERLAESDRLCDLLEQAAECSGLHPITVPVIIPFHAITAGGHAGVTGFIVLAESHIAFHSYPELGFLALDVFTCGPNARPQAALEVFVEHLKPERVTVRCYTRGQAEG